MKKFAIIIIVILTVIFVGCKKSMLEEKELCFQYLGSLQKEFNRDYPSENLYVYTTVKKIFYSKKLDSCLYLLETSSSTYNQPGENGRIVNYDLYNLLTSEKLLGVQGCDGELHCGALPEEAEISINNIISDYE